MHKISLPHKALVEGQSGILEGGTGVRVAVSGDLKSWQPTTGL